MINLSPEVLKSPLWVVPADKEDSWFCYFDWLSQFELTQKKHIQWSQEKGYSLFIDARGLLAHHLLVVHFDKVKPSLWTEVWKSLGEPQTTFFASRQNLDAYVQPSGPFLKVTDIE
jgi:hypothetical protein